MYTKSARLGAWVGLCLAVGVAPLPLVASTAEPTMNSVVKVISADGGGMVVTAAGIVVGLKADRAYVLVANHVVSGATSVQVVFRGDPRPFRGSPLREFHEDLDLAVVVVEPERHRPLPAGLPGFVLSVVENLKVTDRVVAVGHPQGLDWHLSQSSIAELDYEGDFRMLLLVRADIECGSSGGPIYDDVNALIGIVTHVSKSNQYARGVYITEALKVLDLWQVDTGLLFRPSVLKVASSPPSADVSLDGEPVGRTAGGSLTLRGVLPGRYDVRVEKEGHEPWQDEITISRGEDREVTALLRTVESPLPVQLDPRVAYVVLHTKAGLRGKSHRILLFDGGTVTFKKGSRWKKHIASLELYAPTNVEVVLREHPESHPYPGATAKWRGTGGSLTIDKRELKAKRILGKISSLQWLIDGRLADDFVYQP